MANLLNICGKPLLEFIIDPRNKAKAVGTLITNSEEVSAAKRDDIFNDALRLWVSTARDKDEWEFLNYQMEILTKDAPRNISFPRTPPITLIFTEHDTARADPNCSDIPS